MVTQLALLRFGDSLSLSSSAFTYPLLGPDFRRTSSYAQLCPRRVQVEQLGFVPSHLSFLFLHIIHAIRFGLGIFESPPLAPSGAPFPSVGLRGLLFLPLTPVVWERSFQKPSGGVLDAEDIMLARTSSFAFTV